MYGSISDGSKKETQLHHCNSDKHQSQAEINRNDHIQHNFYQSDWPSNPTTAGVTLIPIMVDD